MFTRAELLHFAEEAKQAATRALDPLAPRTPGKDQCKYCLYQDKCPELADWSWNEAIEGINVEGQNEPIDVDELSDEEIARRYENIELLLTYVAALKARAYDLARIGQLPGYKTVQGRPGNRRWTDAEEAEQVIRKQTKLKVKEFTKSALLSPTQIEGLLGKSATQEILGEYIERPDGKLTVAPEDHPSPAVLLDPLEGIETVETDE